MSGLSCISHAVCKTNLTFRKTVPVDEWIIGEKTVCFATIFVPLQHYKHLLSRDLLFAQQSYLLQKSQNQNVRLVSANQRQGEQPKTSISRGSAPADLGMLQSYLCRRSHSALISLESSTISRLSLTRSMVCFSSL